MHALLESPRAQRKLRICNTNLSLSFLKCTRREKSTKRVEERKKRTKNEDVRARVLALPSFKKTLNKKKQKIDAPQLVSTSEKINK